MTRNKKYMTAAGILLVAIVSATMVGPLMSRVEQPPYRVVTEDGPVEIREYGPVIVAEVQVSGDRKAAVNEGFRSLAAYIFGANKPNTKIAMTAPVQQTSSQTIEMTAPVTQTPTGNQWTVRFTMPRTWTLETLPIPNDARVKLRPVQASKQLALRFSGLASDETIKGKTEELRRVAKLRKLNIAAEPSLAFYDPPWTLPFLRRNEVMFEIR
jgi:SOUL heme-binding protein